jgi:hypothetical protein
MRVLVQLPEAGYLRIYGSAIGLLAQRGHTVLLTYDSEKRRGAAAAELAARDGVELVPPVPRRAGDLAVAALHLRIGTDYVRYLDPRFMRFQPLRRRMDKFLPPRLGFLAALRPMGGRRFRALMAGLRLFERAIPADAEVKRYLQRLGPDCVLVSPLVTRGASGAHQTDTVKAAQALGIPVALGVPSWDHLTTKGLIRVEPDAVLVWNDAQRREAVELHGVPTDKVRITGAQLFDHWFVREVECERSTFLESVGLDPLRPYVLYVGSSPNISPPDREKTFVRDWIAALRSRDDERIRGTGILIRPHPGNVKSWSGEDLSDLGQVAVAPRERPSMPMTREEESEYFHALFHAAAVVGVNTSAMVEAAILERPILTVRTPEFSGSQDGTLHFHHLRPEGGGPTRVGRDFEHHVTQLVEALHRPNHQAEEARRFVRHFLRPHGLEQPCLPLLVGEIERLSSLDVRPVDSPNLLLPLRIALRGADRWLTTLGNEPVDRPWPNGARLGQRIVRAGSRVAGRLSTGASRKP